MEKGNTGKYLKYAIGEIILVVIGILIALQINNWNIRSVNSNKEKEYLAEIKENLETDIKVIDSIMAFNLGKKQAINEVFQLFAQEDAPNDAQIVGMRLSFIGQYDKFYPNDLGFMNLISAENIGLIKNNEIRKMLLDYYNFDFQSGTQERIEQVTRDFVNYVVPKLTSKDRLSMFYKVELDIPSNSDVKLANDQQFLSNLHLMDVVIDFQNQLLDDTKKDVKELIEKLDSNRNM